MDANNETGIGSDESSPRARTWSRRRVLALGAGTVLAALGAGAGAYELISHGVLPGQQLLDRLDGTCSIPAPSLSFGQLGPTRSGTFYSRARRQTVGYTIAYPPTHDIGSLLPLIVMLHGFGANHTNALSGMSPAQAIGLRIDETPLRPTAMVTVDGGGGYWNPHPGDNPMEMVVDELIPMCQRLGLGRAPQRIATMGISMGGYGALLLAEKFPNLISAVAAISPAIWTTYDQARAANAGAFASAEDFASDNVIVHASVLAGRPVRMASGDDDPFHPGVLAMARALPPGAVVEFSEGCHTAPFFLAQEPPSLAFLSQHLST